MSGCLDCKISAGSPWSQLGTGRSGGTGASLQDTSGYSSFGRPRFAQNCVLQQIEDIFTARGRTAVRAGSPRTRQRAGAAAASAGTGRDSSGFGKAGEVGRRRGRRRPRRGGGGGEVADGVLAEPATVRRKGKREEKRMGREEKEAGRPNRYQALPR